MNSPCSCSQISPTLATAGLGDRLGHALTWHCLIKSVTAALHEFQPRTPTFSVAGLRGAPSTAFDLAYPDSAALVEDPQQPALADHTVHVRKQQERDALEVERSVGIITKEEFDTRIAALGSGDRVEPFFTPK